MLGPQRPSAPVAGPSRPPNVVGPARPPPQDHADEADSDDDFAPALPPSLTAGPSRPALPPDPDEVSDESDDDVGPMPMPAGASSRVWQDDAVAEFEARQEARRLKAEEDAKPKKLQRDEWMLVPPTESELLNSMDPTKIKRRGFSQAPAGKKSASKDTTLWTETPEDRAKRQAEEVLGKRKKTENDEAEVDEAERIAEERARKRDREMRSQVEAHNKTKRNESLLKAHARESGEEIAAKAQAAASAGWDRDRDMAPGGLMDDGKRKAAIRDAAGLSGRFGSGSYL